MTTNIRPLEVKKVDENRIAVRWSNSPKKWVIVSDEIMIQYVVFRMANP